MHLMGAMRGSLSTSPFTCGEGVEKSLDRSDYPGLRWERLRNLQRRRMGVEPTQDGSSPPRRRF